MGSLRNTEIPNIANKIEEETGHYVFDDWFAPGPEADDYWMKYEKLRGRTYKEAIYGPAAQNIFRFDRENLDVADIGVLVSPAGKSAHMELGYLAGQGKPIYVLFQEEPERWDVMQQFATDVFFNLDELIEELNS